MIRVAVIAALISFPLFAGAPHSRRYQQAPLPPTPPSPPMAPLAPMPPMPPFPPFPDFEDLEDLDIDIDLPPLFAEAHKRPHRDADADADEDDDEDRDDLPGGVHVYKMDRKQFAIPRIHMGDDDGESNEEDVTARAKGRGTATLPVKGPITFQFRAQSGDLEVVTTDKPQVTITVTESPSDDVALLAYGDRIEPSFRGRRVFRHGKLRVELPKGSRLDVSSMSGDIVAQKLGDVRIRTMSGDVKLGAVGKADVQSISGDVRIDEATGPVRLHLVSGHATVQTAGAAPQLEFQSASGSLDWGGICGKDCRVSAETVSGDVRLAVDPKSSFELSYTSHSGALRDEVNLSVKRAPSRKHGMASGWLEATYGKGEGVIEADAFSGNLVVRKK